MTPSIHTTLIMLVLLFRYQVHAQDIAWTNHQASNSTRRHMESSLSLESLAVPLENGQSAPYSKNHSIRGGFDVEAVPWFVLLEGAIFCGASLIHGDIALTAAHCCVDSNGQVKFPNFVRVGGEGRLDGTLVSVIGGTIHPTWSGNLLSDVDVAVMKLGTFLPNSVLAINENENTPYVLLTRFALFTFPKVIPLSPDSTYFVKSLVELMERTCLSLEWVLWTTTAWQRSYKVFLLTMWQAAPLAWLVMILN
jgi:hypothetical protein